MIQPFMPRMRINNPRIVITDPFAVHRHIIKRYSNNDNVTHSNSNKHLSSIIYHFLILFQKAQQRRNADIPAHLLTVTSDLVSLEKMM